ncbi:MFS transporter [Actinomycetospora sp. OC33-EN08]|uniref:MFS transporter n=1 Tax=Actinomycetospora aurantiaca TaxID=3129233 RepID=A0ABU8MNG5_9PSEU
MATPERSTATRRRPHAPTTALLVVTVLVTALNLRPAVVAVAPLIDEVRADLAISASTASLLTTLPLLCFGLGSLPAAGLVRRRGMTTVLLAATVVLVLGIVVRLVPSTVVLFAGTVVAGLAIALGNVLVPALIKRDFTGPAVGRMLGAETVMISLGGAIAAAAMVPVQHALGWSWRPTLALWAVPAVVAVGLWLVLRAQRREAPAVVPTTGARGLWGSPLAWQVTLLMGLQSLHFYAVTTWAPTLFVEQGYSPTQGGLLLALAGFVSLPANYLTPVLAERRATQHHLVVALVVLLGVGYVGILLAPGFAVLWMVLVGLGQGVGLSLGHAFFALRTRDPQATSQLSGMAQGAGYCIAALGPLGLGLLRDLSGSWTVPLVALLVMIVPMAVAGFGAARDRTVTTPGAPA